MRAKYIVLGSSLILLIFFTLIIKAGSYLSSPFQSTIGNPPNTIKVEKVSFSSASGSEISGWFIPGKISLGGILLLHGVRSNRLQMLQRAEFLNEYGYSVLLIDLQAHGESKGKQITFGYLESMDADAAYEFLENKLSNKHIGIIGVSLGGASALLGQSSKKAKAIILESVFPSIEEAIKNRFTIRFGDLGKYLAPLLTVQMEPRLGINANQLRPIDHVANVKGAILIVCGSLDKHTTLDESKRIYNRANNPKQFWAVDGAGHIDFSTFVEDRYKTKVLSFFKEYL